MIYQKQDVHTLYKEKSKRLAQETKAINKLAHLLFIVSSLACVLEIDQPTLERY